MKTTLSAAAVLAMLAMPSAAGIRYDHKLEQAAMKIVAGKIGDIRGSFSHGQKVKFVVRQDEMPVAADINREAAEEPAPR